MGLSAIILAAGQGKRLNSPVSKIIIDVAGKPTIYHVLDTIAKLNIDKVYTIIGYQAEEVKKTILKKYSDESKYLFVLQKEQLGTGHAVMQVEPAVKSFEGEVIILSGDVPLLSEETIKKFYEFHLAKKSKLSVLTTLMPDAGAYGRIVRKADDSLEKIVEFKDASEEVRKIKEINSGIYLVNMQRLFEVLHKVSNKNVQGEYYLTDIIEIMQREGDNVYPFVTKNYKEVQGINTQEDLAEIEATIKGL